MSPSLSWLDPGELARALRRAGVEVRPAARRDLGDRAPGRPLLASPAVPPGAPARDGEDGEYEPSEGRLDGRLRSFARWVLERTGCQSLFIIDQDGLLLLDRGSDPAVVAISSSFMHLLERVHACLETPTENSIAIDLDAGRLLHLLQTETFFGRYALGFVVRRPLDRDLVRRFRRGLARAMSGEEADAPQSDRRDTQTLPAPA